MASVHCDCSVLLIIGQWVMVNGLRSRHLVLLTKCFVCSFQTEVLFFLRRNAVNYLFYDRIPPHEDNCRGTEGRQNQVQEHVARRK